MYSNYVVVKKFTFVISSSGEFLIKKSQLFFTQLQLSTKADRSSIKCIPEIRS